MFIPEEVIANHRSLSDVSARFLEYVKEIPDFFKQENFPHKNYPDTYQVFKKYPLQPWPFLVGPEFLSVLARAAVEVPKLVKSLPERIFGNDPQKIAAYYGVADVGLVGMHFSPPSGLKDCVSRGDFILGNQGLMCLELNVTTLLGGWQSHFLKDAYLSNPLLARFVKDSGCQFQSVDPLLALLRHLFRTSLKAGLAQSGYLNIGFAIQDGDHDLSTFLELINSYYRQILEESGTGVIGKIWGTSYSSGYHERSGCLFFKTTRIHVVLEYTGLKIRPHCIYRLFKSGAIGLYNPPVSWFLGDKRNLALLSRHRDSDLFDEKERAVIRDHIPWSHELEAGEAQFRGSAIRLPEYLFENRGDFVIKKGKSFRGDDVHIGTSMSREAWRERVLTATKEGNWVVQEYLSSKPFLAQYGKDGHALFDLVWGIFGFGSEFGGGWIRMLPKSDKGGSIINSAKGAMEGIILTVS